MFYRFRVIASYLLKVANFNLPYLHLAPPLGWGDRVWVLPIFFRHQKTRVPVYRMALFAWSCTFSRFSRTRLLTDRRTDRHTTTA